VATGDRQVPALQVVLKSKASDLVRLETGKRCEDGTWGRLLLQIHHALYDGVSLPLLMQRLGQGLASSSLPSNNNNNTLDVWKRFTTNPYLSPHYNAKRAFWTMYLSAVEPRSEARTGYPIRRPRVSHIARSAVGDTSLLQRHAAGEGIGVQSFFLASYAKVLFARATSGAGEETAEEVVFGVYLANRQDDHDDGASSSSSSLDATLPRLNLVPLRVKVAGTLDSVARRVQRDLGLLTSEGRADVGLWEVEAWTGVRISSFVNFLSLPGDDDEDDDGHHHYASSRDHVSLRAVEGVASDDEVEKPVYDTLSIGDVVVRDVFPVSG
jgi:hypothetical protein